MASSATSVSLGPYALLFVLAVSLSLADYFPLCVAVEVDISRSSMLGGQLSAPLVVFDKLYKFTPIASGPVAMSPYSRFMLVLAAKRTRRPDVLNKFRSYSGGWNITNKHYWASVGFTGSIGFILASLWFIFFGFALAAYHCGKWRMVIKEKASGHTQQHICLMFLLLFTCTASTGCILLSIGQDEFHDETLDTLVFVLNQSYFTVQVLRNFTDYLSIAKTISIDKFYISSDVTNDIDVLDVDLKRASDLLSDKTADSSEKITRVIHDMRAFLIVIAAVMLLLAILGFVLSVLGHKHAIHIFITIGWLLVAVALVLCGAFAIINNAVSDTCTAMDEWVNYPQAESALSNILPCVDQQTTSRTLYQSKEVILQLVSVVNSVIRSNNEIQRFYLYNQSGPLMPLLCSPYDSKLQPRHCKTKEVTFSNAALVWRDYICAVSGSGSCTNVGRITPAMYMQLVIAVNASYALDYYTPLLLNLQNCNFVRDAFTHITTHYCPQLKCNLRTVNAGLALICVGIILCLFLWIFYADRPQREEVFVTV